ncbi:MAG: hypothetical protein PVF20_03450 [Desulfobacterales bacterium]|jgi:acetate kinase
MMTSVIDAGSSSVTVTLTRSDSAGTIRHAPGPISTLPREPETGVVSSANDTSAVGHRVVRGGKRLTGSVLIDDSFLLRHLAPLHNPPSLEGIEACRDLFPGAFQSAVFDTVFHNALPGDVHLCALPYALHETKRIRPSCVHPIGQRGLSAEQVDTLLNGEGGVLGLNGIVSSDLRGIEATAGQGDHGSSGGSGSLRIV